MTAVPTGDGSLSELADPRPSGPAAAGGCTVLGGVRVDLVTEAQVLAEVESRLRRGDGVNSVNSADGAVTAARPLAIASANIDHIHHFGGRGAHADAIDRSDSPVTWRVLLDGAPLAWRSRQLTGRSWPRLAGSDLIEPIIDRAEQAQSSVGFLGGRPDMHGRLLARLAQTHPKLVVAGTWAPTRAQLADDAANATLVADIRTARCDVLVVGLGKPRQERWIEAYGIGTEAVVLLAFGASADFLAGTVERAPNWVRTAGIEWAYRLLREPRRLARRYLLQGPPAAVQLLRNSHSEQG